MNLKYFSLGRSERHVKNVLNVDLFIYGGNSLRSAFISADIKTNMKPSLA